MVYHDAMADPPCHYVSRGGLKLAAALEAFALDPQGMTCADLGANVGGFTDCLLQRGAARVYSVDTGYGVLAWKLRQDPRVAVLERTNALHWDPHTQSDFTGCDLVVIDLAWTRQIHAIPAALRWLKPRVTEQAVTIGAGRIISLVKPHYEADRALLAAGRKGVLDPATAGLVLEQVLTTLPGLGVKVRGWISSPIRGGAGKGKLGNVEYLVDLEPA